MVTEILVYYYIVGMLVAIVLAMALFVGLFILVAGVLCLTRYICSPLLSIITMIIIINIICIA